MTKQPLTVYLPDPLYELCKREAAKLGVSMSNYIVRQLSSTPHRIDELQNWLSIRLDRLDAAVNAQNGAGK
jgi:hypothetical protein